MALTNQIREALRRCSITRYAIAKQTGIDQGALSRFVAGKAGISLKHLDDLTDLLGLNITTRQLKLPKKVVPPGETRKRKEG